MSLNNQNIPNKWDSKDLIPSSEITEKVTDVTIKFAERFGSYLGTNGTYTDRSGIVKSANNRLTTSQLRKFFGEVKRQQMEGYDETAFILLKPKLAYAVGRAKEKNAKIKDFYEVMSAAIDLVHNECQFKRFVQIFEAIVAYHKAAESEK